MEVKKTFKTWLQQLNSLKQSIDYKRQLVKELKQYNLLIKDIETIESVNISFDRVTFIRDKFSESAEKVRQEVKKMKPKEIEGFEDRNVLVNNINSYIDQLLNEKQQIQQKIAKNIESTRKIQTSISNKNDIIKINENPVHSIKSHTKELKQLKRKLKNTNSAIFNHLKLINDQTTSNKELFPSKSKVQNGSLTLEQIREKTETLKRDLPPVYKEDTKSCYSDLSVVKKSDRTSKKPEKRTLQIVLTNKEGVYDSKLFKDLKHQKKYHKNKGYEQDQISISVENLLEKGNYDERLANKLRWVSEADTFIIQTNDDSIPIDREPAHDLKNVIEVLVRHGLEKPDYQQKGTLNFESCHAGLWSLQRAENELKQSKVGGLCLEGTNHRVMVNAKIAPKVKHIPFGKKILPVGKEGEALVSFENGRHERARAKDFNGNYKYLTTINIPPAYTSISPKNTSLREQSTSKNSTISPQITSSKKRKNSSQRR